ncbi:MAG: hypothetical protein V4631_20310 [Pseudomonadota bacterium]
MNKSLCMMALCLAPMLDSGAATGAEDSMKSAPLPHTLLPASGARAQVHRVRLFGYLEGKPDNAATLASLKKDVGRCVANLGGNGVATKPVKAWPEYMISLREDIYAESNRTIAYSYGIGYSLNARDCSLTETISSRAELVSLRGRCEVDLLAKTASGECDARLHAEAPVPPRMDTANPMAKQFAAMGLTPTATGVVKTVLGVACEVHKQPRQLDDGATLCLGTGGSFPVTLGPYAGLLMESRSRTSYNMTAREAKLDDKVSAAVFTPWLSAGFHIIKSEQQ